jgi:DNA-binding PadR family transcriptional regulator
MTVREGLLALLQEGPRHGYQLKTEFEAATGGVWPLNVGQVYTTLDRLERDGMVRLTEAASAPGQKVYEITHDGAQEVGAWWEAVPAEDPPPRDELMLKVLMAIERGHAHGLQVVTRQRTELLALLLRKRRERSALGSSAGLAATLVTEALLARAEADLRWLDRCEAALVDQRPATRQRKDSAR